MNEQEILNQRIYSASSHILSLSYGKDSIACLGAIEQLRWPLERIIHAEVWATKDIPADLPPMVEFKSKADKIIKERWGIEVEHIRANTTYEDTFYRLFDYGKHKGRIYGFPFLHGPWCNSRLKRDVLLQAEKERKKESQTYVSYVGIAADEPKRLLSLEGTHKVSPLAAVGWVESDCFQWSERNDLLSPTYTDSLRCGCWFCHNQGVDQLRLLRRNYPEYWSLLLKWDTDSPVTFKPDGRTVHDYEIRFGLEDEGIIDPNSHFSWDLIKKHQLNIFMFLK